MNPARTTDNLIVTLSFDFGLAVMQFCDRLCTNRRYIISDQLLRSALSIGANVREAQNAESPADFVHKMKIACKESDEAEFYLLLIQRAYVYEETEELIKEIDRINKVLNKIIATTKQRQLSKQLPQSANPIS